MTIEQHMYTSCPKAKGCDQIDGFQTKARSPGITDVVIRTIRQYCEHYRAPRSMQNLELELRKAGQSFSAETLAQFPVVLSYYPVAEDTFAFTQISYVGQDHSGRFGNFFAHTLVFPVEALQPLDYNPLALARTQLFLSNDTSDRITLPSLPNFHGVSILPDLSGSQIVTREPYRGQLAPLLSATSRVKLTGRPVILCFPKWDAAAPFLEAAFNLLPKETRCRTSFTTYEQDPYRLLKSKTSAQPNVQSLLQIVATLSRSEGGQFQFRPEEYQSQFAVLNFAEQQYSPSADLSSYAQCVTKAFLQGREDHTTAVQNVITQMGVGQVPAQWDVLLPAVDLMQQTGSLSTPEIHSAVTALVTVAHSPSQATTATTLLWPTITRLLGQPQEESLKIALDGYEEIVKQLAPHAERRQQIQQEVRNAVYELLKKGLAHQARMLLPVTEQAGSIVATVVNQLATEGWLRSVDGQALARSEVDSTALIDLFATGLVTMQRELHSPTSFVAVLKAIYEAAAKIRGLPDLWFRTNSAIIFPTLKVLRLDEGRELAEFLTGLLGANTCPEGVVALYLWRWQTQPPQQDEWFRQAPALVKVALQHQEPEQAVRDLVQQVESLCNKDISPIVVAAMWESIDTKALVNGEIFCTVYSKAIKTQTQGRGRWPLRQLLAGHQCTRMLAYDLWNSRTAQVPIDQEIKQWADTVFRTSPHLLQGVAVQLAPFLHAHANTEEALSFTENFFRLLDSLGREVPTSAYDSLLQVAVTRLPLSPISHSWYTRLNGADRTHWPKQVESRFQALLLMTNLLNQTETAGKTLAAIRHSFPTWSVIMTDLNSNEQNEVTHWLLKQLGKIDTTLLPDTRTKAQAALQLIAFSAAHSNDDLTQFLTNQMQDRGLISKVLILAAFAQLAVEEKDRSKKREIGNSITSYLTTTDRSVQNAFWEYLKEHPVDQQLDGRHYADELRKITGDNGQGAESTEPSLAGKMSGLVGRFLGRRQ